MRLDSKAFGLAAGVTAAILSAACALLVAIVPNAAMALLSDVVHADLTGLVRNVTLANFIGGVLFWGVGTGLVFGFAAWLYNTLSNRQVAAPISIRPVVQAR